MNKELLNAILRQDFKSFVIKVFNEVSAGNEYMDNWHIDVVCNELMDMRDGKHNRLIVNVPPRYLKSIICSVALPAFLLGHNPKTNIICVSYNDELSEKFARDCRSIMMQPWYQELFPRTKIAPSRRLVSDFETTCGGGRMATSIGGTLTGRGADWIIIDDPLKPSDAMSEVQREKVNDWYGSTLCSRLNDKATGKIMLIMQRLHQNDLTGFLSGSNAGFKLMKLPIIATEDETWEWKDRIRNIQKTFIRTKCELLHTARENMNVIQDLQSSLGEYGFAGQYQQDPCPAEGGLIKESWLQYYDASIFTPQMRVRHLFISWDTANKSGENNAYSVGCVIIMTWDYKFYLVDVIRGKWDTPELFDKVVAVYNDYKYEQKAGNHVKLLIENKASGEFLIPMLNKAYDRAGYRFEIEAIKPVGDKISRAKAASVMIEKGNLMFPKDNESWWSDFKKELLGFPGSKYKDQVDALSQCINYAMDKID